MARPFRFLPRNCGAVAAMEITQGMAADTGSAIPAKLDAQIAAIPGGPMVHDLSTPMTS